MRALEADYRPITDLRASAGYRARVARALLGKALTEIAGARSLTRIDALADTLVASNAEAASTHV